MATTSVDANIQEVTVEAVVIRRNGDREDLGVVARYNRDDETKNKGLVSIKNLRGLLNLNG